MSTWTGQPGEKIKADMESALSYVGHGETTRMLVSPRLFNRLIRTTMSKRQFRRWRGKTKAQRRKAA